MLHQRGAAFNPIAIVSVDEAVYLAHLRLVNMTADYAVNTASPGFGRNRRLEVIDKL